MVALVRLGPGGGKDLEPCLGEAGERGGTLVDGTGGAARERLRPARVGRFIYFFIFYFRFLQKYIFVFEIYWNIP